MNWKWKLLKFFTPIVLLILAGGLLLYFLTWRGILESGEAENGFFLYICLVLIYKPLLLSFKPTEKLGFVGYIIKFFKRVGQGLTIGLFYGMTFGLLLYGMDAWGLYFLVDFNIFVLIGLFGLIPLAIFTPFKYVFIFTIFNGLNFLELEGIDGDSIANISKDDNLNEIGNLLSHETNTNMYLNPTGVEESISSVTPFNEKANLELPILSEPIDSNLIVANSDTPPLGIDTSIDLDQDGLGDSFIPPDIDGDGIRDVMDSKIDIDGNNLDDSVFPVDIDMDGLSDEVDQTIDTDNDGFDDYLVPADNDHDGIRDNGLLHHIKNV